MAKEWREWSGKFMSKRITILVDNDSWILPYAEKLNNALCDLGYSSCIVRDHDLVKEGWVNFMLGCVNITPTYVLNRNKHNLVVHESALPQGKGFAPMTWQILEGKTQIPICLIEACEKVDAGNIWITDFIALDGTELSDEWRKKQGEKTLQICLRFVNEYEGLTSLAQSGEATFYKRRSQNDSELDVNKSIKDQFNLLRVVDNDRYPGYFYINDQKYILKIEKA